MAAPRSRPRIGRCARSGRPMMQIECRHFPGTRNRERLSLLSPAYRKEPIMTSKLTRRTALKHFLAAGVAPLVFRRHALAAPSETVYHASFGAAGQAGSDIEALTQKGKNKHLKLV